MTKGVAVKKYHVLVRLRIFAKIVLRQNGSECYRVFPFLVRHFDQKSLCVCGDGVGGVHLRARVYETYAFSRHVESFGQKERREKRDIIEVYRPPIDVSSVRIAISDRIAIIESSQNVSVSSRVANKQKGVIHRYGDETNTFIPT